MRERIWYKLVDCLYASHYLGAYSKRWLFIIKVVDVLLLITSLGSIAGWYKFAEHHVIWATILVLIQGIRLTKNQLLPSEKILSAIESTRLFYVEKAVELENLWYKYYNKKLTDDEVEGIYSLIVKEEITMQKINKFEKLKRKSPFDELADEETRLYLQRLNQ